MTASMTSSISDTTTFGRDLTIDLRDEPVGSMSISPSGRDVVLASRKGLYIIDLDNPYDPPRFLRHHTTWEVADVQWSPHASRPEYVVSTSNQKACVWNLSRPSSRAIEHVLHGHTRAITDINWSAFHPEMLATCAVDSFINCWDLRIPRVPVQQFSGRRAAGTQVKWNRANVHVLASSHDNILHIWDDRKGAQPVKSIIAHDARIYGIDWNRTRETGIVTCSSDKCIKFWDYGQKEDGPERIIRTEFPLLRARHVPFGWGVMVMPQRGSRDLYMWDRRASGDITGDPVAKFSGHNDGFLWRIRGGEQVDRDTREFQLVSWGKDQMLRIRPLDKSILAAIGHKENEPPRFRNTRLGAVYQSFKIEPPDEQVRTTPVVLPKRGRLFKNNTGASVSMTKSRGQTQEVSPLLWMRGVRMGKAEDWEGPENFGEEISWFEMRFPQVKFEKINVAGRTCRIVLQGPVGVCSKVVCLRLNVQVPPEYPKAMPRFEIEPSDELTKEMHIELINKLYKTAAGSIEQGRPCIEACVKSLLGEKADAIESEEEESSSDESAGDVLPEAKVVVQSFPLPKKCAAIFCGNGTSYKYKANFRKTSLFFPEKGDGDIDRSSYETVGAYATATIGEF
ncbi:putative RWD, RING finger and WD repeat-containing protein [Neolecta irregularis DAH-3]|uniref:Putative RWD, RING finger and WD repeat-containing protein n=1 Tax=Neolecta irregularis (strain DAH-3) TaxID=1198029 RepID=A0A1U7LV46_NEOID|nr:putative RWD, RING finger and WD repeat-containing protein [Neolecta irregularis DAH-3]|eukprot:OLL26555.1 putative RWD, RING finger and WD repeat-containing protein [Neolecta irregularis DAH-3]